MRYKYSRKEIELLLDSKNYTKKMIKRMVLEKSIPCKGCDKTEGHTPWCANKRDFSIETEAPVTPSEEKCEQCGEEIHSGTFTGYCPKQPSTKSYKTDEGCDGHCAPDECVCPKPPLNAQTRIEKLSGKDFDTGSHPKYAQEVFDDIAKNQVKTINKINELITHIEELYKRIERMEGR